MRIMYIVLMVLLFSFPSVGQRNINKLIDTIKKHDNAVAMTLPGWLMRKGFEFAQDDEMKIEQGYQDIADGIKKMRVVVVPDGFEYKSLNIDNALSKIKEKEGYEDYAKVRDNGTLVDVMVKEKKNTIKNVVVLFQDDETIALLNITTDITMEELKNAALSFNNH